MFGAYVSDDLDDDGLIGVADALNRHISSAQAALLGVIAEVGRRGAWRDSGARDLPHWLSIRYGISWWKADRLIHCSGALPRLPGITLALEEGILGIDKVVELCRFATAENEDELIAWAGESTCATVRRRADLEVRASQEETLEFERNRSLRYWFEDGGRRFGLEAHLPSAQGAVIVSALSRAVDHIPAMPAEHDDVYIEARRADALVALCSQRIAADADADRATVVVHASLDALAGRRNVETELGAVLPPEALQRLACDARIQVVSENEAGDAVGFGRARREPSTAMMRQLRHRDRGCRFPGCGSTAFANAHHIVWWSRGGTTDLGNLVLLCGFHHRLVHEHGWTLQRQTMDVSVGSGPAVRAIAAAPNVTRCIRGWTPSSTRADVGRQRPAWSDRYRVVVDLSERSYLRYADHRTDARRRRAADGAGPVRRPRPPRPGPGCPLGARAPR